MTHDPALPTDPPVGPSLERRYATRAEALAIGRARRKAVPRAALAERVASERDPLSHLAEQNGARAADLVPLRMARMLASPFAFFRGTAGLMALDLAADPHSEILVAACGDAHLSNFGFYASPERQLVFDLNDFDEAAVAPWEWDVKRLVTSIVVGGVHAGYDERDVRRAADRAFAGYASSLRALVELSPADRYFIHAGADAAGRRIDRQSREVLGRATAAAERRTAERVLRRTTVRDDEGRLRFVEQPPTMTHTGFDDGRSGTEMYADYLASVGLDLALVLQQYTPADVVRRVVGVGSVGTRCLLVLLTGADDDALVLQVKEANESVLSRYGGVEQPEALRGPLGRSGNGARVVGFQRVLQAFSDPFLGYLRAGDRDFYVRQFHDMKGSIELEGLEPVAFAEYGQACATMLARAHAQSPTAAEVVGYIGSSQAAGRAIVDWSFAYAQRSLADYEALRSAAAAGRVDVAAEAG
jgi:uncharacterized protein (DUF2252 family)